MDGILWRQVLHLGLPKYKHNNITSLTASKIRSPGAGESPSAGWTQNGPYGWFVVVSSEGDDVSDIPMNNWASSKQWVHGFA